MKFSQITFKSLVPPHRKHINSPS